jgi:transcriptional regulator with XRE-family HTH domain
MTRNPLNDLGHGLGDYLREQRTSAKLSLRQLSELAGISNPYLSQIERGLKKPSAEILQQLAKGLQVSSESLYVRAGILDEGVLERRTAPPDPTSTRDAIAADPHLTDRQKTALLDIYDSFVRASPAEKAKSRGTRTVRRATASKKAREQPAQKTPHKTAQKTP